ncbi:MAG TPA: hypothetical protein VIR29_04000, partial [Anseongella sp.]
KWKKAAKVNYAVSGNRLEIRVPRKVLGAGDHIDMEFKWSDNMQREGDIMDFLLNGDVAPFGRFNYHYKLTD